MYFFCFGFLHISVLFREILFMIQRMNIIRSRPVLPPIFPLIHSFLVTNALSFSKNITGSAVCGIAVLTAAQAILLAFIFSYMITVFLPKRSKFCLFGAEYIVYRSFSGNSDIGCITCPRCFFRRFIYALRHISV